MLTLLLATQNHHKVRELRRLTRSVSLRWLGLDQFGGLKAAKETGTTFRANAAKKALTISRQTILPVLAEDSGLEVRALGGRPGVRSARFAGSAQNDEANLKKLVRVMESVPASRRQARFVCCMALAVGGKLIRTFQASRSGRLALKPSGKTGFGYDPVFIPTGYNKTFAQLGARTKDRLSHRAQAAAQFEKWVKKYLPRGRARSGSAR